VNDCYLKWKFEIYGQRIRVAYREIKNQKVTTYIGVKSEGCAVLSRI
jgi:hypothetical protein